MGSYIMRARQAVEIVNSASRNTYKAKCLKISSLPLQRLQNLWAMQIPNGSLCVFVKDSIRRANPQTLEALRARGVVVAADYVDTDFAALRHLPIDVEIASSNIQFERLEYERRNKKTKIILCDHQADIDLLINPGDFFTDQKINEAIYWGELENIDPNHKIHVKLKTFQSAYLDDKTLVALRSHKYHYCVRPASQYDNKLTSKPITKIYNSLAAGSIPIISKDDREALKILGERYYWTVENINKNGMINDRAKEKNEIEKLEKIKNKYNFKETQRRYIRMINLALSASRGHGN